MKKLMIAAAAAALVGGAFAADTAYTFTASVKTTVGKAGKVTLTYNLGKNLEGTKFWYDDEGDIDDDGAAPVTNRASIATLKAEKPAYFGTKTVSGQSITCLTAAAKKDYAWLKENIAPLADIYFVKSVNKWCETFKVVETGCYRVAGTKKFSTVVAGDFCCSELSAVDPLGTVATIDLSSSGLSQRFGGLTYATAKKAEIFGDVDLDDGVRTFSGVLAGQGSVGKVLVFNNDDDPDTFFETEDLGITSISGYLVGAVNAPDCENCCALDVEAIAFTCEDDTPNTDLTTAGYGTFSLKYNAKATKALAN